MRALATALLAVLVATTVGALGASPAGAAAAPLLWTDVMEVEFAPTTIGSASPPETVTFTNNGPAASGVALALEGSSAFRIELTTCQEALAATESCTARVRFNPTTGAMAHGAVVLSANGGSRRRISLVGRPETSSPLRVISTGMDFGPVPVGVLSDGRFVSITNTSSAATSLSLALPTVTGTGFAVSDNSCGATLAGFANCRVSYRFRPQTAGRHEVRSGLTVTVLGAPRTYPVTLRGHGGRAGAPVFSVNPTGLDFGPIAIGGRSFPQRISVTNTSSTPQTVRVERFSPLYEVGAGCSGQTLAPGVSCGFDLVAAPTELGLNAERHTAEVEVGGRSHPVPMDLSVTAVGNAPRLRVTPSWVDFGPAPLGSTPRVRTVRVTNTGTGLAVGPTVQSTPGTPLLAVTGSSCGATLPAGASCTLSVRYTPTAAGRVVRLFKVVAGSVGQSLLLWGGLRPGVEEAWVIHLLSTLLGRLPAGTEARDLAVAIEGGTTTRSAVATAMVTGEEYVTDLVQGFYIATLGRPGEAAGVAFWVAQIRERRRTVAQVVTSFYGSPEYFAGLGGGTKQTWVADVYRKLLGRPADAAGLEYWVDQVTASSRTRVAQRFYETPESRLTRVRAVLEPIGRAVTETEIAAWITRLVQIGDLALAAEVAASADAVRAAQDVER